MASLQLSSFGDIRVTDDKRFSVFDIIEVIGGKKNPRDAWNDLTVSYPEVVGKTDNFQFPGQGQRPTPVSNVPESFYIIGLLPGQVGKTYREEAALLMCEKLNIKYEDVLGNNTSQNLTTYAKAVNVEVVEEDELDEEDIQLQVLDATSKIAATIVSTQKANKQRFNDLENVVRQTSFDTKAEVLNEVREVGHALSEDSKVQTEALNLLQSGIDDINKKLEAKKNRVHPKRERIITIHVPTDKAYDEILALVEASGMTRTGFCCEVLLNALGITL